METEPLLLKTSKDGRHYYVVNDKKIPSVTTIIDVISKPGLIPWARNTALSFVEENLKNNLGQNILINETVISNIIEAGKKRPDQIKDEAGVLGGKFHQCVNSYLNGKDFKDMDIIGIEKAIESFREWYKLNPFIVLHSELPLHSVKYEYAGTVDIIGKMQHNEEFFIADWKTSNGVYPAHALQVSAYANLWREHCAKKDSKAKSSRFVNKAFIFWFSKKSLDFKTYEVNNISYSFHTFLAAKLLYDGLKTNLLNEAATTLSGNVQKW